MATPPSAPPEESTTSSSKKISIPVNTSLLSQRTQLQVQSSHQQPHLLLSIQIRPARTQSLAHQICLTLDLDSLQRRRNRDSPSNLIQIRHLHRKERDRIGLPLKERRRRRVSAQLRLQQNKKIIRVQKINKFSTPPFRNRT